MTKEEHKTRHVELHNALDELFADFILNHPGESQFHQKPIIELIEWSYSQMDAPSLPKSLLRDS